jgi:hypothetical protein
LPLRGFYFLLFIFVAWLLLLLLLVFVGVEGLIIEIVLVLHHLCLMKDFSLELCIFTPLWLFLCFESLQVTVDIISEDIILTLHSTCGFCLCEPCCLQSVQACIPREDQMSQALTEYQFAPLWQQLKGQPPWAHPSECRLHLGTTKECVRSSWNSSSTIAQLATLNAFNRASHTDWWYFLYLGASSCW